MVEIVSGLQTNLNNVLSGNLTYKGKKLEFKEVEGSNGQVYQAQTNLTDEEIANGNNDAIITFSLEQAVGNCIVTRVPIEENEREEILKSVNQKREKAKDGNFEAKELNRAEQFLSSTQGGNQSTQQQSSNKSKSSNDTEEKTGTEKVRLSDKDIGSGPKF